MPLMPDGSGLFDVIAVNLITHKIELIAEEKTARNADAIEAMAIKRQGIDIVQASCNDKLVRN